MDGLNWRDWSALPTDVLLDIVNRFTTLSLDDHDRFGRVCVSWRRVIQEKFANNIYMLIAPSKHQMALYNLSNNRIYHLQPAPRKFKRRICLGSSFGWLVTIHWYYKHEVQLHNLISNSTIDLPPLGGYKSSYGMDKAVLSCDPLLSDDYVVMATTWGCQGLAYYRAGGETWTSLETDLKCKDVIFCHKTKQFYLLLDRGELLSVEFAGTKLRLTQVAPPVISRKSVVRMYLVEDLSSGDLLQIHRYYQDSFKLFKLDPVNRCWIKIDGIGDNVLFLNDIGSMLCAASDCPGYEPNSICFPEEFVFVFAGIEYYLNEKCYVYNLEDGVIRPHHTLTLQEFRPSTICLDPFPV